MKTFEQRMAETAFKCLHTKAKNEEYRSFALAFPSLIHSCGLVQAVAFAESRNNEYLEDLGAVLDEVENFNELRSKPDEKATLSSVSRRANAIDYMRLSRRALSAASWLKRYVQALNPNAASSGTNIPANIPKNIPKEGS